MPAFLKPILEKTGHNMEIQIWDFKRVSFLEKKRHILARQHA